jgi:hypothetical protein
VLLIVSLQIVVIEVTSGEDCGRASVVVGDCGEPLAGSVSLLLVEDDDDDDCDNDDGAEGCTMSLLITTDGKPRAIAMLFFSF